MRVRSRLVGLQKMIRYRELMGATICKYTLYSLLSFFPEIVIYELITVGRKLSVEHVSNTVWEFILSLIGLVACSTVNSTSHSHQHNNPLIKGSLTL